MTRSTTRSQKRSKGPDLEDYICSKELHNTAKNGFITLYLMPDYKKKKKEETKGKDIDTKKEIVTNDKEDKNKESLEDLGFDRSARDSPLIIPMGSLDENGDFDKLVITKAPKTYEDYDDSVKPKKSKRGKLTDALKKFLKSHIKRNPSLKNTQLRDKLLNKFDDIDSIDFTTI